MGNQSAVLSEIHIFSPRVINDFRSSVARELLSTIADSATSPSPGVDAVPGGWPAKLGLPSTVPSDCIPQLSIAGLSGGGTFGFCNQGIRATTAYDFTDTLTYVRGNHTFKFGAQMSHRRADNLQEVEGSGTFNFTSSLTGNPQSQTGTGSGFASFLLGSVASATGSRYIGEGEQGFAYAGFANDDWKVNRRLTLNIGLRYDYQQWPQARNNGISNFSPYATDPNTGLRGATVYGADFGDSPYQPNRADFSPRFGFAYDVFGKEKTVIRGGYGMYRPNTFYRDNFGITAGFASVQTTYTPPGNNSNLAAFQFQGGFPTAPLPIQGAAGGPSVFLGQNAQWDQSYRPTPLSQQWNFSIQQQLPGAWLVEVTYTGNHGTHMVAGQIQQGSPVGLAALGGFNYNELDPQYYSLGLKLQSLVANPYAGKVPGSLGASTITLQQSLLPYPYYQLIAVPAIPVGNYNSHEILTTAQKRLSHGMVVLVSYTMGKVIDDGISAPVNFGGVEPSSSVGQSWQDGKYNRAAARGLDPLDVSQRLSVSGVYELPFGSGKRFNASGVVDKIVGGWQVNAIYLAQTGLPLAISGANNFLAAQPNSTGISAKLTNPTAAEWFDTSQFVNPSNYTFGNLTTTLPDVRSPGTQNLDLSLTKNTAIRENWRLQFRAESFNALNHVNLLYPNTTFVPGTNGLNNSGTFGTITKARDPRTYQFGLKLIF